MCHEDESMSRFAINGRIFEFPLTGVGRFCVEVIKELDNLFMKDDCVLLIPNDAKNYPPLNNIEIIVVGERKGIFWEQIELPLYLKKHKLVGLNMSNSAPLVKSDFVVLHDIQLKKFKSELSSAKEKIKVLWPLFNYRIFSVMAKHIFTVSEFQKMEIMKSYAVDDSRITVVYNGWQHMLNIKEDNTILGKYGLEPGTYVLATSTRAKNKNFKWVLNNAKYNPNLIYVITGKFDTKYFNDDIEFDEYKNIVTTGYVTDENLKSLMMNARAFIYPSLYEGFGIPPLEALSVGTRSIVSNTSCLPEIYGDYVEYIDPLNANIDLNNILSKPSRGCERLLDRYSWKKTAKLIYDVLTKDHGGY